VRHDSAHGVVDAVDIEVGQQTRLQRNRPAGHPSSDEVAGRVFKSGIAGLAPLKAPAKNLPIEGG
jgi:hypothetical protein